MIEEGTRLKKILINHNGLIKEIKTEVIFVYIGRKANLDFCEIDLQKDNNGYLLVDQHNQTSQDGIFAAGDVTCKLKQVITACGDGANAYYFAKECIDNFK